jgi:hypothetical protein
MRSAWPVHGAMMHAAAAVAATVTDASAASANLHPVVIQLAREVRSAKDLDRFRRWRAELVERERKQRISEKARWFHDASS